MNALQLIGTLLAALFALDALFVVLAIHAADRREARRKELREIPAPYAFSDIVGPVSSRRGPG